MHLKNLKCQYLQFVDVSAAIQVFHVMCFCAYLLSARRGTPSQARECDKRKPEPRKNTRLCDRRAKGSGQQSTKKTREVASSIFAPKVTKKNGGPGAT